MVYLVCAGGSDGKTSACNAGRPGFDTWVREDPLEKEMVIHSSSMENPMDGGPWYATVHGVAKSRTQLSDFTFFLSLVSATPAASPQQWDHSSQLLLAHGEPAPSCSLRNMTRTWAVTTSWRSEH